MASFQNTFRNERGITSSSPSSNSSSNSDYNNSTFNFSSDLELNDNDFYDYNYTGPPGVSGLLSIFYKLLWGVAPKNNQSPPPSSFTNNDLCSDLRN